MVPGTGVEPEQAVALEADLAPTLGKNPSGPDPREHPITA